MITDPEVLRHLMMKIQREDSLMQEFNIFLKVNSFKITFKKVLKENYC